MPKVSEMITRKFLAKEDLSDGAGGHDEWLVTCGKLLLERMRDDSEEQRWVLYFKEHRRGLVLGTTVLKFLEKELGEESDAWAGRQVVLYVDPTIQFKGQVTGGLRLKRAAPPKPAVVPKVTKGRKAMKALPDDDPEVDDDLGADDDIP